jgi:hypothetical protein
VSLRALSIFLVVGCASACAKAMQIETDNSTSAKVVSALIQAANLDRQADFDAVAGRNASISYQGDLVARLTLTNMSENVLDRFEHCPRLSIRQTLSRNAQQVVSVSCLNAKTGAVTRSQNTSFILENDLVIAVNTNDPTDSGKTTTIADLRARGFGKVGRVPILSSPSNVNGGIAEGALGTAKIIMAKKRVDAGSVAMSYQCSVPTASQFDREWSDEQMASWYCEPANA